MKISWKDNSEDGAGRFRWRESDDDHLDQGGCFLGCLTISMWRLLILRSDCKESWRMLVRKVNGQWGLAVSGCVQMVGYFQRGGPRRAVVACGLPD